MPRHYGTVILSFAKHLARSGDTFQVEHGTLRARSFETKVPQDNAGIGAMEEGRPGQSGLTADSRRGTAFERCLPITDGARSAVLYEGVPFSSLDSSTIRFRCGCESMSSAGRPFFCLFISLSFATATLAQDTSTGAIRGTVGDSGGARIGACSIVLVNAATNFRYSTSADSFGRFAFELLPPGDYSARADSPGMSPQTTPSLHVDVGGTTELVFKLAVAGNKETVTVSGEPPLVESQPSGISSLIDERAINELPLNGIGGQYATS